MIGHLRRPAHRAVTLAAALTLAVGGVVAPVTTASAHHTTLAPDFDLAPATGARARTPSSSSRRTARAASPTTASPRSPWRPTATSSPRTTAAPPRPTPRPELDPPAPLHGRRRHVGATGGRRRREDHRADRGLLRPELRRRPGDGDDLQLPREVVRPGLRRLPAGRRPDRARRHPRQRLRLHGRRPHVDPPHHHRRRHGGPRWRSRFAASGQGSSSGTAPTRDGSCSSTRSSTGPGSSRPCPSTPTTTARRGRSGSPSARAWTRTRPSSSRTGASCSTRATPPGRSTARSRTRPTAA